MQEITTSNSRIMQKNPRRTTVTPVIPCTTTDDATEIAIEFIHLMAPLLPRRRLAVDFRGRRGRDSEMHACSRIASEAGRHGAHPGTGAAAHLFVNVGIGRRPVELRGTSCTIWIDHAGSRRWRRIAVIAALLIIALECCRQNSSTGASRVLVLRKDVLRESAHHHFLHS